MIKELLVQVNINDIISVKTSILAKFVANFMHNNRNIYFILHSSYYEIHSK